MHVQPKSEPKPKKLLDRVPTAKVAKGASGASTTFIIPRRASIRNGDQKHKVTVTLIKMEAVYSCVCFPRAVAELYRKATMQNRTDFPLLAGQMTVFVNNNLLTTNNFPRTNPNEVFFIYLGRDDSIRCKYKLDKKDKLQTSTGTVFKARSESYRRTVELTNTGKVDEVITIFEQIPVPSDDKIKVKVLEPDCVSGRKDIALPENVEWVKLNDSNHLEYRVLIPQDSVHLLKIHYVVEWPEDRQVRFDW